MTANDAASVPAAAAMVRRETIGNTVATIVIAVLLTWAIFRGQTAITALAAPPGGIFGIAPGTFNFTLLVTIALTLIVRRRVNRGQCVRLRAGEGSGLGAALPSNVVLRAATLAVIVSLVLVPSTFLLVGAGIRLDFAPAQWSFAGMLTFFVVYFAVLSLIVTPIVVWRALRD